MARIASVVFRSGGKIYQFDAGQLELVAGDHVIVDTTRGVDVGKLVDVVQEMPDEQAPGGLKRIVRKMTERDHEAVASRREAEVEAKLVCRRLAEELKLEMKIIEARQVFDGTKMIVTFFAEERVDFRELLVKANDRLKRRIELRQVSARDESRIVGGYGPCGRPLCCATFAGDQEPVSIRMAKAQSLPLNPTKISGCCGRLMCCLKYEHETYLAFQRRAPKRGAFVKTPEGEGRVVEVLTSRERVAVDHGEGRTATYTLDELERPAERPSERSTARPSGQGSGGRPPERPSGRPSGRSSGRAPGRSAGRPAERRPEKGGSA